MNTRRAFKELKIQRTKINEKENINNQNQHNKMALTVKTCYLCRNDLRYKSIRCDLRDYLNSKFSKQTYKVSKLMIFLSFKYRQN